MENPTRTRGRPLLYPERMEAKFRPGTMRAIAELKAPGEAVVDFVRQAVDREIERRSTPPQPVLFSQGRALAALDERIRAARHFAETQLDPVGQRYGKNIENEFQILRKELFGERLP